MMTTNKKRTISLLIIGLLFSLACSLADLTMAGNALHASLAPAAATVTQTVRPTSTAISPTATARAVYTVCTGVADGQLRVRRAPGTATAVAAILSEGSVVTVRTEVTQEYEGTWAQIDEPAGWVNARYLCEEN